MEMLWRVALPLKPSVTINAFASLPSPPRRIFEMEENLGYNPALQCLQGFNQARAQLECELIEEAQKLDCKYNTQQIKMERRHE